MIDKQIKQKIEQRAFEIFEWRKENGVPGSALGDWLEAECEIITDRRTNNNSCPECGFKLLALSANKIICLNTKCDYSIEAKRKDDSQIPNLNDIKKDW
jgi:DNA-directed RNA polymerase subunit RPC12/RpoP